ncbi:hypothetical protein CWS51_27255, partial [Klebsiella michiganensis]|nr:hypothetical protein [Klebsiella michiganensis]
FQQLFYCYVNFLFCDLFVVVEVYIKNLRFVLSIAFSCLRLKIYFREDVYNELKITSVKYILG